MGAGLVIEIILAVFTNKMGELKVLLVNIKLSSWKKVCGIIHCGF